MRRPLTGILLGAFVWFIWGAVSWTVLPWHAKTVKHLPEEQLITDTLKTVITEPGFYVFPHGTNPDGTVDQKSWAEKYRRGPVGNLIFSPVGSEPMGFSHFLFGFMGAMFVACATMFILYMSRGRINAVLPRAFVVMIVGVIVAFSAHFPYWNWFNFPLDFTLVSMADSLISFLLLGLTQAAFVPKEMWR